MSHPCAVLGVEREDGSFFGRLSYVIIVRVTGVGAKDRSLLRVVEEVKTEYDAPCFACDLFVSHFAPSFPPPSPPAVEYCSTV